MDSGAANDVMPKRMLRDKKVRPSKRSMAGVHCVAANNGMIQNEGEFDFEFLTAEGEEEEITFQVAEANKALGSISYLLPGRHRL